MFLLTRIIDTTSFEFFIFLSILVNSGVIMCEKYPQDEEYEATLEAINLVFYWIYVFEMVLKIVAMGPLVYARQYINLFDAFIVLSSTAILIMETSTIDYSLDSPGLQALRTARILRTLRALRALRVIRLARHFEKLYRFFQLMMKTLWDIAHITILLFIVITMYALIGMELFAYGIAFDENDKIVNI